MTERFTILYVFCTSLKAFTNVLFKKLAQLNDPTS